MSSACESVGLLTALQNVKTVDFIFTKNVFPSCLEDAKAKVAPI